MPGIKHATKKRFEKAKTTQKTIQTGINAEYTEYKNRLQAVATAINNLIKKIQSTAQVWASIANHQIDFASTLVAALASDGVVRSHAREVENTVRQLQRLILQDGGEAAPHRRITAVLDAYLKSIETVQADYHKVETSYTEVNRYQKKVGKLNNKKHPEKKKQVLTRNVDKLQAARLEHDRQIEAIVERMKTTYEKHEAVFQCAHHAFWIAQESYSSVINDTTKSIRWESMAVREHLVNIDVNSTPRLPPIPRVQMLLPAETATEISSFSLEPDHSKQQTAVVVLPQTPQSSQKSLSQATKSPDTTATQHVSPTMKPIGTVPAASITNKGPLEQTPTVVYGTSDGNVIKHASTNAHKTAEATSIPQQHPIVQLAPESPPVKVALPPKGQQIVQTIPHSASGQGNVIYIPAPPTQMPGAPTEVSTKQSGHAEPQIMSA